MTLTLTDQIRTAHAVGTPLIGLTTAEPAAAIEQIKSVLDETDALLNWDVVRGLRAINKPAEQAILPLVVAADAADMDEFAKITQNPIETLTVIRHLDARAVVIMQNTHRILDNHAVAQATWNLRDEFKADGRMLILVAPHLTLPAELTHDIMLFDDPLPTEDHIEQIVLDIHAAGGVTPPEPIDMKKSVKLLRGLSAFEAEQVTALSLRKSGLNQEVLSDRARRAVEQTPGLRFLLGGPKFDSVGGMNSIKALARGLFRDPETAPAVIVFWDEFEKWCSGIMNSSGDNGVSKDAFQVALREITAHDYRGMTLVGPPGTGKTVIAHAIAAEFGAICLEVDMGDATGSLQGESQAKVRALWKTIHALAGDRGALIVCAANSLPDDIPTEINRRVGKLGIFYIDLPTAEERLAIWPIHLKRHGIEPQSLPNDEHWTGADIEGCCDLAEALGIPLTEAAKRLVPIARSQPETINRLRKQASGRWQSANEVGTYVMPGRDIPAPTGAPTAASRKLEIGD